MKAIAPEYGEYGRLQFHLIEATVNSVAVSKVYISPIKLINFEKKNAPRTRKKDGSNETNHLGFSAMVI